MAPTPPSVDAPASTAISSPDREDRTKRNVACVNCRNSKVRCRTSQIPGKPCQRCAKLEIPCVVDKSHKRITRRSKLEQLEQELKTIKRVVNPLPRDVSSSAWTPPSPRINQLAFQNPPVATSSAPQVPTPLPDPPPSVGPSERQLKTGPSESRILNSHVVPGEDIDWYFNKYLQCFHHFMPILRKKDPDECYKACPTLFWVILYIACRRYTKDRAFFSSMVDHISKDIWTVASDVTLGLDGIHALILLCTWPLPTVRLVTDPSSTLASIAMNLGLLLGLHTGRGYHPHFCTGARQDLRATDEEASTTWLACCIVAHRTASTLGHPPPSIQHDESHCKVALDSVKWAELITIFDLHRFSNRFLIAMSSQISVHDGVLDHIVTTWENEFEMLKPLFPLADNDIMRFFTLATQIQLQSFYFIRPPNSPTTSSLKANAIRAFNTCRAIVNLATDLESRSQFLTHASNGIFRTVVDASCIALAVLHSTLPINESPNDANILAQKATAAVLRCSVREGDLPYRACVILETFWSVHHTLPKIDCVPGAWSNRLSTGVTHWCIGVFKDGLQGAQKTTEGGNKAPEGTQPSSLTDKVIPTGASTVTQPTTNLVSDPFQDVDWSLFMDDFGWAGGGAGGNMFLGFP